MLPIKTALLSFGMSGQVFHAPFLHQHNGFEFYRVWERSKKLAESTYPGVKSSSTFEEILHDKEVELVIVNTPNSTHFAYAKKALLAGKHVIVEKPFTVYVNEAEELIQLAKENNLKLSVYHNRRYDSDYKAVKKVVDEKLLGQIVEAEFHFDRFKEEISPKVHKETPGPGTGALYDLGSHLIDQALQLFGMPDAVFADIRTVRKVSKVDDYFEVLMYYPDLRVRLHSSYLVREPLPAYILHGTKGSFIKAKTDVQESALQQGKIPGGMDWGKEPEALKGLLHTEINGKIIHELIPSFHGNYMDYFEGIHQSVRMNEPMPVNARDGLQVIRIIEAATDASRQGKLVSLSHKKVKE